VFRIPVARWVEEALPALRRAGATDGEVSDFTTIIIRRRTRPWMRSTRTWRAYLRNACSGSGRLLAGLRLH